MEQAKHLRGLSFEGLPKCEVLTKVAFQRQVASQFSQDISSGELMHESAALKMLGFIPESFDYPACIQKDALENVSAFYDAKTGTVFLPDWRDTDQDTLVHEAVHAIQDAHYHLEQLKTATTGSTDRALALAAAVEGDAVRVQEAFKKSLPPHPVEQKQNEEQQTDKSCSLPETLMHQYEFPYSSGLRFALGALEHDGAGGLEPWLQQPPVSSTHVLYRYSKRLGLADFTPEVPSIQIPSQLQGITWKELDSDTLGEYTIRTLLREYLRSTRAIIGAMGWRGDRYVLFTSNENPSNLLLVWESIWADEKEATEFVTAYYDLLLQHGLIEDAPSTWYTGDKKPPSYIANGKDGAGRTVHLEQHAAHVIFTSLLTQPK